MVLIEVHHLEAVELVGDFLDLLLLTGLDNFHAWSIPIPLSWSLGIAMIRYYSPLDIASHIVYYFKTVMRINFS